MDQRDDGELVALAQEGRAEAFMELARRLEERIRATIFGLTRNAEDAADLTQETFLAAFRSLKSFDRRSGFYTWVYRIAVNRTLNFLKRKGREKGREAFEENRAVHGRAGAAGRSPEGEAMRNELREKVEEAVDALSPVLRATFNLVAVQGISHGDAARVLGCSENTVSWRMHKARKKLRFGLRTYLGEAGDET